MAMAHRQALLTEKLMKSKPRQVETSRGTCSCVQQLLVSHHTKCCDADVYEMRDAAQVSPGMLDEL